VQLNSRLIISLAAAVLLAALGGGVAFHSFSRTTLAAESRQHVHLTIKSADNLQNELTEAETGQRGYALTGDEAFLESYLSVRDRITGHLTALRQMLKVNGSLNHVDALIPLIDAKLVEMARVIEMCRNHDTAGVLALVSGGDGKRLMDSIRGEIRDIIVLEEAELVRSQAAFRSNMRRLFIVIVGASLFALLFAMSFAYLLYQQNQHRLKSLVHLETHHLLEIQQQTTSQLQQANITLRDSQEQLAVTLGSIGDAVLATDARACVTRLNPVAEQLTGWTHDEALGRPVDEIFHIINKETRLPSTIPVLATLATGTIHGLANHTVLIARNGSECDIADSCAPIRDRDDQVIGAVLVFRDVTGEYAAQQALRDSSALVQTILNTVVDGVITFHASSGIIETVNPAIERMFGYTAAELNGENLKLLIPGFNPDQREGSMEYSGRHKDAGNLSLEIATGEMWLNGQRYFTGILRDITARKQVEEALLEAGALQSAIFNSANFSSIATDAKGVIQIFNVGAERMLGYTAAEVMDKITPAEISDPQEIIARATALSVELGTPITPGFEALVFKASRGIEDIYELTYIRKDGSRFPAVVSVTALRDDQNTIIGYLLIGTDNTARKQAEEALLKADALQSAIFNSANFSSIATDAKGVIQIFNVGAERMLGYTAVEVMDKITPAEISDPQEIIARATALSVELGTPITPGFEALVFKASRGIEDIYELTYIRKDGSRFPAVVSVTALRDAQNTIIGYLLIGTDNTARKQVEEERTRITVELEKAKAIAEKANLAKSDFLSSMSHELRSPLNAILGFSQLMDSDTPPPTPAQKESIAQILHAGWYLLELINEILDLAVVESGRLSLSLEPVSLPDVMIECQAMIEPQAQKRGITMTFPQFDEPIYIKADHTRVKQVLINLLSNAIKYNRVGGSVRVECVTTTTGGIRISVKDTGAGLPPENIAQLFQPFNRLGQESGGEEGTGIGLVVSKRLVELMQGMIGVESTVGIGSVFWIELAAENDPHTRYINSAIRMTSETPMITGARSHLLLYVEDNPANLKLVEQLIARRPDLRLLTAQNGMDGINLARTCLPDVILMDINLPGINGIEAMKILRLDSLTAHIPILALSANVMPRDIEKGLASGFFRYLTKPIKVDQFMVTLDEVIEFTKNGAGEL